MENGVSAPGRAKIAFRHLRTDKWWVEPLISVVVLVSFIAYSTWRAFENAYYYVDHLVSPFYSPCLATSCPPEAAIFGTPFGDWWTLSPALLILVFPLGFRLTCYYYRKTYYSAFWMSPPVVLLANAIFLWMYSLSCHSCRHAIGGRLKHFSKHPFRYKAWTFVSNLNPHHPKFAWVSLIGVALCDLYVRSVATGQITNIYFF